MTGGCKHAIAFLMWVHRKSEHPSVTEVECYWRRSALSSIGTAQKFIALSELSKINQEAEAVMPDNSTFLKDLMTAKGKEIDSQITRHNFTIENQNWKQLSIHQLAINFCTTGSTSADDFVEYCTKWMPEDLCQIAESCTRSQSGCTEWYELRYGRITASKIYEAAKCKVNNGSLVKQIIGSSKVFQSEVMERGRRLEKDVLDEIKVITGLQFKECGLFLLPDYPILGASPDAVGNDFVVEIKCPSSMKTFKNYITDDGQLTNKCKAQINMQMFACKKKKGFFGVADPSFEETKVVTVVCTDYDEEFIMPILESAVDFWKTCIFSHII